MRQTRGRVVEVGTLADLDRRLAAGARSLDGWRVTGVDLRERGRALADCRVAGATFLGCTFAGDDDTALAERGALVLPTIADTPVDPYRAALYSPDDLYDAPAYPQTLDARAYAWSRADGDETALLARTLHDHAIDRALVDWVAPRRLVGVMGGHGVRRGEQAYADAARLGHALGDRLTVATGGGPGAMEAANLGARLSGRPVRELHAALDRLAEVASYRPSVTAWAEAAREVADGHGEPTDSLGIPTWHYGHEPPNLFATAIAKYFRNAQREAILLEICDAGIVFLPGVGGTVQEIFQDACENFYADESSVAPMVLVGRRYWTEDLPAWPLLRDLAVGRPMESHIHLVDSVKDAARVLEAGT